MATQGFVQFKLTPRTKLYVKELQRITEKAEFAERIVRYLDPAAQIIAGRIVATKLSGQVLKRRTGNLARSVIGRGEILNGLPAFRVGVLRGPAVSYVATQELGTVGKGGELPTIKPKRAKALAIPLEGALTPSGVERFGGPRGAPVPLRFIPFRRGVAVGKLVDERQLLREQAAAQRAGREVDYSNVTSYYLLVRKVDIAPKHFIRDGVRAALPSLTKGLIDYVKSQLTLLRSAGR